MYYNDEQSDGGRTMIDLQESRRKIDEIDSKLLELFETRMKIAGDVAEYKASVGKPIFDPVREVEKISQLQSMTEDEFNKKAVKDLFTQIISISKRLQYKLLDNFDNLGFQVMDQIGQGVNSSIIYYGEKGSYTEQAMMEYFGEDVEGRAVGTFEEVMLAINNGEAEFGVLPMENSSTGTLADIFDLLALYDNYIIGEHVVKIEHNLWGLPGSKIENIKKVYSHRQGLMQCSNFLADHPQMEQIVGGSTASSARKVLEEGDMTQGAICSKRAGVNYGLALLQEEIHNEATNSTRFIIISNQRIFQKDATRTSICFASAHKTGSLYHLLSHFIYNNLNLSRIESRPIPGKPFEYRFFVDIEGSIEDPAVKNALQNIKDESMEMKILGSFTAV